MDAGISGKQLLQAVGEACSRELTRRPFYHLAVVVADRHEFMEREKDCRVWQCGAHRIEGLETETRERDGNE